MKFATISPTRYLREFCLSGEGKYHMLLAQRVLTDEKYLEFYNGLNSSHFKILDNGACELKKSISYDRVLKAVDLCHPNVLVLPDSLKNAEETLRLSFDFLNIYFDKLNKQGVEFMSVVQGSTKEEWLNCFRIMNKDCRIKYLGISDTKAVFPNSKFPRVDTIKYLLENGLLMEGKQIHLLGLGDSGHIELKKLKAYSEIEGCDSGAPIVHGANMIKFVEKEEYSKIHKYLDPQCTLSTRQKHLSLQNLKLLERILNE